MHDATTPTALILARAAASRAGDFGYIYDSYLEDSNFRRQFPLRQEYLDYAAVVLGTEIVLHECRVLRERRSGDEALVILYQRFAVRGDEAETLELAHLRLTRSGWRFDYSERLERSGVGRPLEEVDWDDFSGTAEKVVF